ncbi:YnbE family lipoprotein [Croceicoccus sp. F390]|uniref:YnbE family lipoprotein n=1 Tax=Croceicoccus esteveae TaxID=3075597 RepID=A0ABU2ZJV6_9SPHN|nr:YnbE family lipoprotein [Croceicoccus sp. F390]MDT0576661.1 YnbE family lipoprotein [Croceicoccus sp. F390]
MSLDRLMIHDRQTDRRSGWQSAREDRLDPAGSRPDPWIVYARRAALALSCATAAMAQAGCVTVNAPSEPIVIELNVNIKQEVLYRLVAAAEENIEANPEIF